VSQTSSAGGRPALVTFAAILLIMLGGFELVLAITEFFRYALGTLPPWRMLPTVSSRASSTHSTG